MLEGTEYTTNLDPERLIRIRDHFAAVRPKYKKFESATLVDTDIFSSQIPGGMLSNMESQLKAQGAGDRIKEVMAEVPLVKADCGHPPLVTPSSQIVGTQAVFNVLMGRYKVMTGEFADLMLGYYGECMGERNPEVVAIAQAQAKKEPITVRPADLIPPEWGKLVDEATKVPGNDGTDEDVLTYAMFPQVASAFFATRDEGPKNVGMSDAEMKAEAEASSGAANAVRGPIKYKVSMGGRDHSVTVEMA
jgi:methylmalonyl-CoA carboxyltransferase 5S subunit